MPVPLDESQTRGPFFELVSGLQSALDACPAMPGVALGASIEDCLRRPSPGAASWSLGTTRMFVGGALSLVSRSPRSLCQAVVTVLVRFIAERGCGITGEQLNSLTCVCVCARAVAHERVRSGVLCRVRSRSMLQHAVLLYCWFSR